MLMMTIKKMKIEDRYNMQNRTNGIWARQKRMLLAESKEI